MKRTRHDTEGTTRAFTYLVIVLAIIMLALNAKMSQAQTLKWPTDPSVKYYAANSPAPLQDVEEAIDYVVWSWASRIPGLDIKYVGTTLGPTEHAVITYRWLDGDQHFKLTGNLFSRAAEQTSVYIDSGFIARSVIYLNAAYFTEGIGACEVRTFSHELGHALGAPHSSNSDDLMYYAPSHCRADPTDSDIRLTGHEPATCHVTMTLENDLVIPEIYGKQAYLKYNGDFTWTITYLADKLPRACSGVEYDYDTGELRLDDIRAMGVSYSAVLVNIGNDRFKLEYAE